MLRLQDNRNLLIRENTERVSQGLLIWLALNLGPIGIINKRTCIFLKELLYVADVISYFQF